MGLDDMLHHGEANPGSFDVGSLRGRAAKELAVDLFLLFRRDSKAAITDGDCDPVLLARDLNPDLRRAGRVFDGIVQQVPQRTSEGFPIGADRGQLAVGSELHSAAALRAFLLKLVCGRAHQFADIDWLEAVTHHAGFHAAKVEQSLDKPAEPVSCPRLRLIVGVAAFFACDAAIQKVLRQLTQGSQRGPKLGFLLVGR